MGLRCLTSSSDGRVFAGFHSGHLKCYHRPGAARLEEGGCPATSVEQMLCFLI